MKKFIVFALLILLPHQALGWSHGSAQIPFSGGHSEGQAWNPGEGGDYPFINLVKSGSTWGNLALGVPSPAVMDTNGYPTGANNTGFGMVFNAPGQAERPGHQVITWVGSGSIGVHYSNFGSGGGTIVSCVGTSSGAGNCDNSSCTSLTGSISGKVLTVTVASSCSLVIGQPISGFVSTFDVPTFIVGNSTTSSNLCSPACTGAGGTGTYAINWSQTVASGSIPVGGRVEFSTGTETNPWVQWAFFIASTLGNPMSHVAFMHVNDEAIYWTGEIFGTLFKQRIMQGGFGVWRNLDWHGDRCTTWATRTPLTYYSWNATETLPSWYAGNLSYALNGSSNDYSVTFGSGGPVDKQIIVASFQNTATNTTVTFNLNGTGAVPVGNLWGAHIKQPTSGSIGTLIYDQDLNTWLLDGGDNGGLQGLDCRVPPEVFLQLAKETGVHPWFVAPVMATDPMTDWFKQLAAYVKANQSSWMIPRFEITNETWNTSAFPGCYASPKSFAHWGLTEDAWCGSHGDIPNWMGLIGSKIGQDVASVYGVGNLGTKYKVITGVQTISGLDNQTGIFNHALNSNAYVTSGPAQSGYTQTAASGWVSSIAVAPYWSPIQYNTISELVAAYSYSVSPSDSLLTPYIGTEPQAGYGASYGTFFSNWTTFYTGFGLTSMDAYEGGFNQGDNPGLSGDVQQSVTAASNASSAVLTMANTATFTASQSGNVLSIPGSVAGTIGPGDTVTGSGQPAGNTILYQLTAGNFGGTGSYQTSQTATLSSEPMATNGPYTTGMTVKFTAASGGTWSSIVGNSYTISAVNNNQITINLNSTGLGTFSSGTLDFVGSQSYVNSFRAAAYNASQTGVKNIAIYNAFTSNGGEFPSMYVLSGPGQPANVLGLSWAAWFPDIYGATNSASDRGTPQWQAICAYNGKSC